MQNFASAGFAVPQVLQVLSMAPKFECTGASRAAHSDLGHTLHVTCRACRIS
jgi:hypothetical protein